MEFDTKAVHIGEEPDADNGGDVVMPIHTSSTFARKEAGDITKGYAYTRLSNPTRDALEKRIAALEEARHCLTFASGMAAEAALTTAILKSGDHIVASDDLYAGTKELFGRIMNDKFKIAVDYVDASNPKNIEKALKSNTKIVWLETPSNPRLTLCDIKTISSIAHKSGAKVVVDNTFASPYFQRPLSFGADVVVHSTTKYLNGHSDSIGGAVVTSDDALRDSLFFIRVATGGILSPFDSFLVLRGLKTLGVRMRKHEENAMAVAKFLEQNKAVESVIYPGLESHPQHALAKKQMYGFGGMVSFTLKGGYSQAQSFLSKLKLITLAVSLGGVESLIEHPASMTHGLIPREEAAKIGEGLIRLSVGIEDKADILSDLSNALV